MKPKFRNPNLILVRKRPKRSVVAETDQVADYTDEETYKQSLLLRRFAKRVTGSPFIRLDQ